jgi:hypothetical protein
VQENKKIAREHKNVHIEMDFELLSNVFFVFVPNFSKIYLWGELLWGKLSMGRVVHGFTSMPKVLNLCKVSQ